MYIKHRSFFLANHQNDERKPGKLYTKFLSNKLLPGSFFSLLGRMWVIKWKNLNLMRDKHLLEIHWIEKQPDYKFTRDETLNSDTDGTYTNWRFYQDFLSMG